MKVLVVHDKVWKSFSYDKLAKDLHMQKAHNIKILQFTPGQVHQNTRILEKYGRTRPATKCTLCSYICKIKPSMNKHIEIVHKDKKKYSQTSTNRKTTDKFYMSQM